MYIYFKEVERFFKKHSKLRLTIFQNKNFYDGGYVVFYTGLSF